MAKTFEIANNSTIISVNDDGSVTQLGFIDSNGNITGAEIQTETIYITESNNIKTVFMLAAIIVAFIFCYLYFMIYQEHEQVKSKISDYNSEISKLTTNDSFLKDQNRTLQRQKDEAELKFVELIKKINYHYPIIITDIQIANISGYETIETSHGGTLYSSRTMYLEPMITYEGLINNESKRLYYKLYTPNGSLSQGSSSPSGYTTSTDVYIYNGNNTVSLAAWGNSSMGTWEAGNYRIEVWYNNICLKSKSFTIY
jgi:cell division protein FtsB